MCFEVLETDCTKFSLLLLAISGLLYAIVSGQGAAFGDIQGDQGAAILFLKVAGPCR